DASPCFRPHEFVGAEESASVSLVDSQGKTVAGPSRTNHKGQYVIPRVPAGGGFQLRVRCANYDQQTKVPEAAERATYIMNIQPPKIISITAKLNGNPVQVAPPGSVVQVTATVQDDDNHTLAYFWSDGTKGFTSPNAAAIQWKLLAASATNVLSLHVSDGM